MAKITGLTPAPTQTVIADQTPLDAGPMANVADFDPVDVLPFSAAEKLRMLRQRANDLHKMVPQFAEISEANTERIKAERELKRLTDHAYDDGFGLAPTDPRVVSAQRRVTKLSAEAQRLQEGSEKRAQAWHAASAPVATSENLLRHGIPGNCKLESVEVEPVKLLKGESVTDAIERLRRRGRELKADLHRIESAPFPSSYAKQRMREQVEILAQRGETNVAVALIEHGNGKLQFQRELLRVQIHNIPKAPAAIGYAEAVDPAALVAWLFKEALIKRLDAEIDSEADDRAALSPEAREKAEAEVRSDILANDRDECALVWTAQAQNLPVEHRSDSARSHCLACGWLRHRASRRRLDRQWSMLSPSSGRDAEIVLPDTRQHDGADITPKVRLIAGVEAVRAGVEMSHQATSRPASNDERAARTKNTYRTAEGRR